MYGDYETLGDGRTADALVDFTGGVAEKLVLANLGLNDLNAQLDFFTKLKDAIENRALINCNIDVRVTVLKLYSEVPLIRPPMVLVKSCLKATFPNFVPVILTWICIIIPESDD